MFFAGRRNSWVERGPDGNLQEARRVPVEHQAPERETEKRRDRDVVIEVDRERDRLERDPEVAHLRRNLPTVQQVERLLDLYVATGEGRGAYVKAQKQVAEERRRQFFEEDLRHFYGFDGFDGYDGDGPRLNRRRRPRGYGLSVPGRRHSGSSHSSDDDNYRGGGRIPNVPSGGGGGGGGGGLSAGPEAEYIVDFSPPRRPRRSPTRRVVEIIQPQTGDETVGRQVPSERHRNVVQNELRTEVARWEDEPRERPYLRVPTEHRGSRGYRHPTVHELSSDDDFELGSLPSEEDDVRLEPLSRSLVLRSGRRDVVRMRSVERERDLDARRVVQLEPVEQDQDTRRVVRNESFEQDLDTPRVVRMEPVDHDLDTRREVVRMEPDEPEYDTRRVRMESVERDYDDRGERSTWRPRPRGAGAPDDSITHKPSGRRGRLRGGGPAMRPPTKTSAVAADVVEDYDIRSKPIVLYFFTVTRGRIVSSRHAEIYRTFRELYPRRFPMDIAHRSDSWLVETLKKHYWIISRESRRSIWDLFSMRTIGFATFIRFERTVKAIHDSGNFIVTARAPAISAEGSEAVSHFVYMMRYPLQKSKMMLFLLDRLAGTTRPGHDHNTFYVVELKETFDTSKIYILLAILIVISTGAGVLYAVLKSDPGTGLSIASYILTCLSLILAVVAAGEWLGITKPDAFSFAYDWVDNRVVSREDFGQMTGRRLGR